MLYKTTNNNFKIPAIWLWTWWIGGFREADYKNDKKEILAIKKAIELGYTHIDTAELYGAGHTDELIAEAIKDFDRSKIIITSKVFKTNLKYDDVITSCKKSLERLKTDYIDIFLIHAPNPDIPIEKTMKAMDYLVEQKMIKYIGVSNFSVEQMKEAQKYSKNKIVVNQILYNLVIRDKYNSFVNMESEIIPYCQENNIVVMTYRPIERGFLLETESILDELSEKYNKTKAQIAINWLISKKWVITIPKSTNIEHLKENIGSVWWSMSKEDLKKLDEMRFDEY